ncbi:DUF1360 domain-containing protein [Evansella sp. LMS18]|uniref:DUF1360 domain-containing protein n=1 Tax=Evansella sp. LMS18 TaxID=2924033 RepID=UPI0020D1424B|nr:DUF1360 domain-containing protein [Evansella sp. LMS18]UTR11106.1 DUF1360 domain-containing protein [Evansella sp. LMS18]
MAGTVLEFTIFALAVFRFTHLIVYDSILESARGLILRYETQMNDTGEEEKFIVLAEKGWKKWAGELITCHWCTGLWVSFFLWGGCMVFPAAFNAVIWIFAAAGLASVIHTIVIKYIE